MANTKTAPAAPKLVSVNDDEWDAIKLSGGPGRQAKPSTQLETLKAAVASLPESGQYENSRDGWYRIGATAANTVDVIARELRKGVKQLNADRDADSQLKVETRPRKDHPKLGDFVAFRVTVAPVETPAETESETEAAAS